MKLVRKDDHSIAIVGTLEKLLGQAEITGGTRRPDGSIDLEFGGYTEIYWDSSETLTLDGQRVFLDEDGEQVLEQDIDLIDD